jgi:hypothetical protein
VITLYIVDTLGEQSGFLVASDINDALASVPEGHQGILFPPSSPEDWWDPVGFVWVPRDEAPDEHSVWDPEDKEWLDPRTLSDLKDAKWEEMKGSRGAQEFGPFTWATHEFQGDTAAQDRIKAAALEALMANLTSTPWSREWTLAVALSGADMVAVFEALQANVADAHATAQSRYASIQAATTAAEVNAITW